MPKVFISKVQLMFGIQYLLGWAALARVSKNPSHVGRAMLVSKLTAGLMKAISLNMEVIMFEYSYLGCTCICCFVHCSSCVRSKLTNYIKL